MGGGDIEMGTPAPPTEPAQDRYMEEFFKEVSAIKVCTTPLSP